MNNYKGVLLLIASCTLLISCKNELKDKFNTNNFGSDISDEANYENIIAAAERVAVYIPLLKDKKVAIVVNQTSTVSDQHLLDTLLSLEVDVQIIFTPEHGFKGTADAGDKIEDGKSDKANIPIISLYGKKRKPGPEDLEGIDVILFDIQDVGVRFYTYISTLHNVMESAAENNVPIIVLDRPNPNGFYVDGPVLEKEFTSFVGMHPVPVVYGMTIGEYAQMINGESWLPDGAKCDLKIIPCKYYDHTMTYDLPIKPSPNLPNLRSILLYPSICFFEGTKVSVGRGTDKQFQVIGHPSLSSNEFSFTPESKPGATKPKHMGEICYGQDFTSLSIDNLHNERAMQIDILVNTYKEVIESGGTFFIPDNNFFDKLAGSENLRNQLLAGKSAKEIEASWQYDLEAFKKIRSKYLLYYDF